MMPDRHGGLIADRHMAKYCPYCREGRVCPTVTAQRWRERAQASQAVFGLMDDDDKVTAIVTPRWL